MSPSHKKTAMHTACLYSCLSPAPLPMALQFTGLWAPAHRSTALRPAEPMATPPLSQNSRDISCETGLEMAMILTRLCLILVATLTLLISPPSQAELAPPPLSLTDSVVEIEVDIIRREQNRPRHHLERCSGALIRLQGAIRVLSAWHCFDGYENLAKPPRVHFKGQLVMARLLRTGGSMANDWALLALTTPLEGVTPLPLVSDAAKAISMGGQAVGFPRNTNADNTSTPQHSPMCEVIGRFKGWWSTRCQAIEGMSGGPFVTPSPEGPVLSGIVSARDSDGRVLIAPMPHWIFRRR